MLHSIVVLTDVHNFSAAKKITRPNKHIIYNGDCCYAVNQEYKQHYNSI